MGVIIDEREPMCLGIDCSREDMYAAIYNGDIIYGDWFIINGHKFYISTPTSQIRAVQLEHRVRIIPQRKPEDVFSSRQEALYWFGVFTRTGRVKPGFERRA